MVVKFEKPNQSDPGAPTPPEAPPNEPAVPSAISPSDLLMNDRDLAKYLGSSLATVRAWRLNKQGPRFIKIGGLVRYRMSDVLAYFDSRTVETKNPPVNKTYPAAQIAKTEADKVDAPTNT